MRTEWLVQRPPVSDYSPVVHCLDSTCKGDWRLGPPRGQCGRCRGRGPGVECGGWPPTAKVPGRDPARSPVPGGGQGPYRWHAAGGAARGPRPEPTARAMAVKGERDPSKHIYATYRAKPPPLTLAVFRGSHMWGVKCPNGGKKGSVDLFEE